MHPDSVPEARPRESVELFGPTMGSWALRLAGPLEGKLWINNRDSAPYFKPQDGKSGFSASPGQKLYLLTYSARVPDTAGQPITLRAASSPTGMYT